MIFSHAFGFCNSSDPVYNFTGTTGGLLAVYIFFAISGYLISESWFRAPEIKTYFIKRILRIYPALIFTIVLSVFFFGPILTSLPLKEYFTNSQTYSYFVNLTLWKLQYRLPGIFINGVSYVLNAPLWTLFFEFAMYISLPVFAMIGILKKQNGRIWLLWLLYFIFLGLDMYGIPTDYFVLKICAYYFIKFFLFFYAGVLFRHYAGNFKVKWWLVVIFLAGAILSRSTFLYSPMLILFVASFVFWFAFIKWRPLKFMVDKRDYSYGVYLYGYIIQNFVQLYFDCNLKLIYKIPLSIAGAFIFAFISWHLVESKALKLKMRL